MGTVNSVELILTLSTSSSSVPLLEKLRDPTGVFTKRRKEGTIDTENKNGCFRWAWWMNWAVCKLRNHIVHTEGIQGINHSNRQTISSHQDNIDSFLVWSEPFYCPPKTCSQTCQPASLFYEMLRTKIIFPPNTSLEESKTSTSTDSSSLSETTKEVSSPQRKGYYLFAFFGEVCLNKKLE